MKIRYLDYDSIDDYEQDAASNFSDGIADCTSEWNDVDSIVITEINRHDRFQLQGNRNDWNVGCQRIIVILNEDNEEIYKPPFDSIYTCDGENIKERVVQVREELLALQSNGWKPMPNEEREMNAYIKDCENEYMPDIF